MKDLIKSQLYQLRRSRLIPVVFIVTIAMQISIMMGEWNYQGQGIYGSTYVATSGSSIVMIAIIFAIVFTGEICGADFLDKTTNYELMSGHTRKQIYFSRAIISLIGGGVGGMIIMAAPVIVSTAVCGWGTDIKAGEVIFRYVLSLLPVLRIICEFIFLTYIVKNPYVTMVCGFLVFVMGESWPELVGQSNSVLLGITNISMLTEFESWSTYTLDNTVDMIMVYGARLSAGDIAATVFGSIIIGGMFLAIGYIYFNRDDLN